jgi:methanogenic corrinoid protein MtbC1
MNDLLSFVVTEPSRRAIIQQLQHRPRSVSELVAATGLKQPNVSNHLARMRRMGIVAAERVGREVHYRLAAQYAYLLAGMRGVQSETQDVLSAHTPEQVAADEDLAALSRDYLAAILAGRQELAETLVIGLFSLGADLVTLYARVLEPALQALGDQYAEGRVNVADEHRATAITNRIMARLAQFAVPHVHADFTAVVGSVEGNRHSVGAQMISDGLASRGWTVHFLDGDVPSIDFIVMIQSVLPDIVAVSCASEDDAFRARDLMQRLRQLLGNSASPLLCIGGRIFQHNPLLLHTIPHDLYAGDLVTFLAEIDRRYPS